MRWQVEWPMADAFKRKEGSVWRRARQTALRTLHSANLPVRSARSNKSGSTVVVPSELMPTAIDATMRHGMGGARRQSPLRGWACAQVAGECRHHGGGRPRPGLQRATALRCTHVPRRARPHALLAPRSFLVAQAQPSSRVTSSWLGLALISGQDVEGNWHTGTLTAAADDVCAVAIMSVVGIIRVSIHYHISYFTPAKLHVCTHHTTTSLPTTVFSQVSFSFAFIPSS